MNKETINIQAARIAKEIPRISAKVADAEASFTEAQALLVAALQELEELYLSLDTGDL